MPSIEHVILSPCFIYLGGLNDIPTPPGVPVATVGIDGAKNAAVLAVQMLAISDEALAEKLAAEKKAMADGVIAKDKALQEQIAAL